MTTIDVPATDAPTTSIDLIGRPVVVAGKASTIIDVKESGVVISENPDRVYSHLEVVPLPVIGELVEITAGECEYWLGSVEYSYVANPLEVYVLAGGVVKRRSVALTLLDARKVVREKANAEASSAMQALIELLHVHADKLAEHQSWVDQLVEDAHEEADQHGWCAEFDEFMESHGLPARIREFNLRVQVTATVYMCREGASFDAVVDSLDSFDIQEELSGAALDWQVEPD